jgi:hypothetical protein
MSEHTVTSFSASLLVLAVPSEEEWRSRDDFLRSNGTARSSAAAVIEMSLSSPDSTAASDSIPIQAINQSMKAIKLKQLIKVINESNKAINESIKLKQSIKVINSGLKKMNDNNELQQVMKHCSRSK